MTGMTSVQKFVDAWTITRGTQVIPDIKDQERGNIPVTCMRNFLRTEIRQKDA